MSGIFLIGENNELVEMSEQPYDSETVLQELLAKFPNILVGSQMDSDEPRKWLLVTREMSLPSVEFEGGRWSVDHLFLDQDGIPTLVEIKRSSDTRLRREVVGQLLEYAANAVVYWPVERVMAEYERQCERRQVDPDEVLANFLGEDQGSAPFWESVRTNLQAGKIRLVFVADVIPRELRRIVEFLNEQMSPADVFAVEVKQFAGEGHQALVPRLIGAVERKPIAGSRRKKKWTEETFFQDLAENNREEIVEIVRKLLAGLRAMEGVDIWWGEGVTTASFVPQIRYNENWVGLFRVVARGARIETYFGSLKNKPPFASQAKRRELRDRYNAIAGVDIPDDGVERYPSIPLEVLAGEEVLAEFLSVHRWVIEEIHKT